MGDVPIKKNVARTVFIPGLISQADTKLFKTNPTLAAGDFKYSADGGAWTNLATLPDVYPAAGTQVRLQLSQAELNCDQLNIAWIDAAGAEWCSGALIILTATLQTADAPTNSAGVTTVLADYARRTGDYATAADVWAYATRTLSSFGTLVADVWAYATRTLTQTAAQITAILSGSTITVYNSATISISLVDLGDVTSNTKLWFTAKNRADQADSYAVIQVERSVGAVYINGAAATAAHGSLVVDDDASGDITITVSAANKINAGTYLYDVKMLKSGVVSILTSGTMFVNEAVTDAVA